MTLDDDIEADRLASSRPTGVVNRTVIGTCQVMAFWIFAGVVFAAMYMV